MMLFLTQKKKMSKKKENYNASDPEGTPKCIGSRPAAAFLFSNSHSFRSINTQKSDTNANEAPESNLNSATTCQDKKDDMKKSQHSCMSKSWDLSAELKYDSSDSEESEAEEEEEKRPLSWDLSDDSSEVTELTVDRISLSYSECSTNDDVPYLQGQIKRNFYFFSNSHSFRSDQQKSDIDTNEASKNKPDSAATRPEEDEGERQKSVSCPEDVSCRDKDEDGKQKDVAHVPI
mmetsp:Transcript_28861/g.41933  ORF Transcript_28861/g.41933 Transcript_28861/m.41933 type:complete len:233 (+) Transcript_28861:2021-2719(+)